MTLANRITTRMYGRSVAWFRRRYDLREDGRDIAALRHAQRELYVGTGTYASLALARSRKNAIVLGGPCIDHADGEWHRLTFQAIADCWIALAAAADFNLPCLITIQDAEALVAAPPSATAGWALIVRQLHSIIARVGNRLGCQLTILTTSDVGVAEIVSEAVRQLPRAVVEHADTDLYRVNLAGAPRKIGGLMREVQQRNIALHLPHTVSELVGKAYTTVITVENLQQVRALHAARAFAAHRGDEHLVHVAITSSPSLSGRIRMSRAPEEEQIFVADSLETIIAKLQRSALSTLEYWRRVVPLPASESAEDVAHALQQWSSGSV